MDVGINRIFEMSVEGQMRRCGMQVRIVLIVCVVAATTGSSRAGDGIETWHVRHTSSDIVYFDVAWGNGAFAAAGQGQSVLWSADGATWAPATVPPPIDPTANNDNLLDISFNGSVLLASGLFDGTVISSADASVWSNVSARPTDNFETIAGQGDRVVVGGRDGDTGDARIFTSADGGVTFTEITPGTGSGSMEDIDSIPDGFSALGWSFDGFAYTNKIFFSSDGVDWSNETTLPVPSRLNAVELGNGVFVAVGYSGSILTSPDGLNWTVRSSGTEETLFDVAFGNGIFAVVGGSGVILSSPDGVVWTPQVSGTAYDLKAVGFGEDTFVIFGLEDPLGQDIIVLQSGPVYTVFGDGFETGTTGAWSATTGG